MEIPAKDQAAIPAADPRIATLINDMLSLAVHMQDVRKTWAIRSGVTGPKWLILFAVSTMNGGLGATVGKISARLRVNSSFVTAQSKLLEKEGLLTRRPATRDRRQVLMSLTPQAQRMIAAFQDERSALHREIFGVFDEAEFSELAGLVSRLETVLRVSARELKERAALTIPVVRKPQDRSRHVDPRRHPSAGSFSLVLYL